MVSRITIDVCKTNNSHLKAGFDLRRDKSKRPANAVHAEGVTEIRSEGFGGGVRM